MKAVVRKFGSIKKKVVSSNSDELNFWPIVVIWLKCIGRFFNGSTLGLESTDTMTV